MEVGIIFGGRSCEHDVSIITAVQCMANIDRKKYNIHPIYLSDGEMFTGDKLMDIEFYKNPNLKKCSKIILNNGVFYKVHKNVLFRDFKLDVCVMCCHGGEGENGTISGLLEYNKIPYTSTGVLASAITMDKVVTKQILEGLMVNVAPYIVVKREDYKNNTLDVLMHIETFLDYPLIVKPASLGSSIGIRKVSNRDELSLGIEIAGNFDEKIIVEKALSNFCELNCAVIRSGNNLIVSDVERPLSQNDILTFSDKYLTNKGAKYSCRELPANIEESLYKEVQDLSLRLYQELNLDGVVRIDFLVNSENKLFVNEINSIPGSLSFYLFEGKMSYRKLIDTLIDEGINRALENKNNSLAYKSDILRSFTEKKNGKQLHK